MLILSCVCPSVCPAPFSPCFPAFDEFQSHLQTSVPVTLKEFNIRSCSFLLQDKIYIQGKAQMLSVHPLSFDEQVNLREGKEECHRNSRKSPNAPSQAEPTLIPQDRPYSDLFSTQVGLAHSRMFYGRKHTVCPQSFWLLPLSASLLQGTRVVCDPAVVRFVLLPSRVPLQERSTVVYPPPARLTGPGAISSVGYDKHSCYAR